MSGIQKAIAVMGSQVALARAVGVTPQAVHFWATGGRVGTERVLSIARATGGRVRPHDLRPDVYPDPHWLPPGLDAANG